MRAQTRPAWRHPHLIAGALHRNNLARLVEHADGWIPPPYGALHDVAEGVGQLKEALAAAGRNLDGFGIQGDIDSVPGDDGRPSITASMEATPSGSTPAPPPSTW